MTKLNEAIKLDFEGQDGQSEEISLPTDRITSLGTEVVSRILGAAMTEFATKPYDDASFNQVIRTAGISKGMMYYYFKSKEDLFVSLLHSSLRRFLSRLSVAPQVSDRVSFWIESGRYLETWLAFLELDEGLARFVHRTFRDREQALASPAAPIAEQLGRWAQSYLEQGQRVGAVRSDQPTAWLVEVAWSQWDLIQDRWMEGEIKGGAALDIALDLWRRTLEP